jgi:hypothetical protein
MGIDGIGHKILTRCALALYKPLHHLLLLSLSKHTLPSDCRVHLIIPVFKSGDKSSVRNYRLSLPSLGLACAPDYSSFQVWRQVIRVKRSSYISSLLCLQNPSKAHSYLHLSLPANLIFVQSIPRRNNY